MALDPALRFPLMCLTLDGTGLSHAAQAERLCAAGARWVQLRMKGAGRREWLSEARAAVEACRRYAALLVVNDSVEIALESGAHGVHLGGKDGSWEEARRVLGPTKIVGGTVNNAQDAARAAASASLDYVGVGPLRFTATKKNLSPVLGISGIRELVGLLGPLPAWGIGGVVPGDMAGLRSAGAAGAAVSSALRRPDSGGVRAFIDAWQHGAQAVTFS